MDVEPHILEKLTEETNRLARTLDRVEAKRHWSIYTHPFRFFIFSFLNGLFIALGSTLGLAIFLYILHLLGYLPFFGDLFDAARQTISS